MLRTASKQSHSNSIKHFEKHRSMQKQCIVHGYDRNDTYDAYDNGTTYACCNSMTKNTTRNNTSRCPGPYHAITTDGISCTIHTDGREGNLPAPPVISETQGNALYNGSPRRISNTTKHGTRAHGKETVPILFQRNGKTQFIILREKNNAASQHDIVHCRKRQYLKYPKIFIRFQTFRETAPINEA